MAARGHLGAEESREEAEEADHRHVHGRAAALARGVPHPQEFPVERGRDHGHDLLRVPRPRRAPMLVRPDHPHREPGDQHRQRRSNDLAVQPVEVVNRRQAERELGRLARLELALLHEESDRHAEGVGERGVGGHEERRVDVEPVAAQLGRERADGRVGLEHGEAEHAGAQRQDERAQDAELLARLDHEERERERERHVRQRAVERVHRQKPMILGIGPERREADEEGEDVADEADAEEREHRLPHGLALGDEIEEGGGARRRVKEEGRPRQDRLSRHRAAILPVFSRRTRG